MCLESKQKTERGKWKMERKSLNLTLAAAFALRLNRPHSVVLGDDNKYWVVHTSKVTKYEKAGYQVLSNREVSRIAASI